MIQDSVQLMTQGDDSMQTTTASPEPHVDLTADQDGNVSL